MRKQLEKLEAALANGSRPTSFRWHDFSESGITYETDEEDNPYALVGYNLPDGVYAEIDDGTFGTLQGIRIYL